MSITGDIKGYADNAVAEGRKVLDSTLNTAQAQLNDLNGNVQQLADKATEVAKDVRDQAEKAINVDAIKSAVEPYLEQAKSYQVAAQDRVESVLTELRKDPRFAKALDVSEAVLETVVETVQEYVVKPVQSATGLGAKPTRTSTPRKTAAKPAAKRASKPAATSSGTARTSAATRPAAKKTTARKTATKRTSASS